MESIEMLMAVAMGLALAATCGLRAFLPLFAVGCMGALGKLDLADSFQWLQQPIALVALGLAVIFEVAGDKFPVVDHFLDSAAVFIKPIAAMIASASVMADMDPMFSTILGLVMGGSMAEGVHLLKMKTRVMSSAMTATVANPFLSLFEDLIAVLATALSLLLPILVLFLAIVVGVWVLRHWKTREIKP